MKMENLSDVMDRVYGHCIGCRYYFVMVIWDTHHIMIMRFERYWGLGQCCAGKKVPPTLPRSLARLAEPVLGAMARRWGQRPLYTKYSLDTVESKTRFSSQKAHEELGYATRSIHATIRDTVQWLKGYRP